MLLLGFVVAYGSPGCYILLIYVRGLFFFDLFLIHDSFTYLKKYLQGREIGVDPKQPCQIYYLLFILACDAKLVCSRLERIQRDFLWDEGNLERKPYVVTRK